MQRDRGGGQGRRRSITGDLFRARSTTPPSLHDENPDGYKRLSDDESQPSRIATFTKSKSQVVRTRAITLKSEPERHDSRVIFGGKELDIEYSHSTKEEVGMHKLRWATLHIVRVEISTEESLSKLCCNFGKEGDVSALRRAVGAAVGMLSQVLINTRRPIPQLSGTDGEHVPPEWSVTIEGFGGPEHTGRYQLVCIHVLAEGDLDEQSEEDVRKAGQALARDLEQIMGEGGIRKNLKELLEARSASAYRQYMDDPLQQTDIDNLTKLGDGRCKVQYVKLPAGYCNLYKYPRIVFGDSAAQTLSKTDQHDPGEREIISLLQGDDPRTLALDGLILAIAADKRNRDKFFNKPDSVGARAIHALLVADTTASVQLAIKLFEQDFAANKPGKDWLMMQHHGLDKDIDQDIDQDIYDTYLVSLFTGETCFHVVAANRKEDELCIMLDMLQTYEGEDPSSWRRTCAELITEKVDGHFFKGAPMCYFGSTAVAFAATFGLKKAVKMMFDIIGLDEGLDPKRLNDRLRDRFTGFLPLHAVVASCPHMQDTRYSEEKRIGDNDEEQRKKNEEQANTASEMCNWLIDEVGQDWSAKIQGPSSNEEDDEDGVGAMRLDLQKLNNLTPLQLAVRMGCPPMIVEVLVRRQTRLVWCWGNLVSYHLDLTGIDSATKASETSVMELIARVDAQKQTKELLLGTFLDGLIFELFREKRKKFLPLIMLPPLISLLYAVVLLWLSFRLKSDPVIVRAEGLTSLVQLASFIALGASVSLSLSTYSRQGDQTVIQLVSTFLFWSLENWWQMFYLWVRVIGCSLAFWACVLLNQSLAAQQAVIHPANAGRNLRASGQHIFEEDELGSLSPSVAGGESDLFEGVWPMLAIAVFFELFYLTDAILRPFDTLILVKIYLTEIIVRESGKFLIIFVLLLFNFYGALYVVYPRAGHEEQQMVDEFNDWRNALASLMTLALTGEPLRLLLLTNDLEQLSWWQWLDFCTFLVLYVAFILVAFIMLLNLLIAMMNDRYKTVSEESELSRRYVYAQQVLRTEAIANFFFKDPWTNVGEKKKQEGTRWYYEPKPSQDIFSNASQIWTKKQNEEKKRHEDERRIEETQNKHEKDQEKMQKLQEAVEEVLEKQRAFEKNLEKLMGVRPTLPSPSANSYESYDRRSLDECYPDEDQGPSVDLLARPVAPFVSLVGPAASPRAPTIPSPGSGIADRFSAKAASRRAKDRQPAQASPR